MRQEKDTLTHSDTSTTGRFVVRTLIFGSILIILNCYWIISAENRVVYELTDFSIFPTVLFTLVSVASVNLLLKRFFKGLALSEAELALTYIMVSVATALAGHDIIRQLVPLMANPFWYATPENEWEDLFFRFIPTWLAVENRRILQGYFEGDKSAFESFWTADYLNAWLTPVLAWTALVIVLLFVMLCMNIIVRKQWIEFEKLSYPLTVMPIEVIGNTSKLFSNKFIWISFGLAFALEILAGLNFLYPVVPALKAKFIIPFTERPWNTMGWAGSGTLPVYVYPFAIGFGYLMPLDLSLSLWLFFLFWQAQDVFFNATGWTTASALQTQQRAGAWIGIGVMAVWSSRRHIMRGLRGMFSSAGGDPLYPFAVVGLVLGITFVVVFWLFAGLSPWVVISYFVIYYVFCTAITRMRAELGPPTHELHGAHPDQMMVWFMGTRPLGAANLTNTTLLSWLAYGYRSHPMPHQLEGFKIGSTFKLSENRLVVAMIVASIVGAIMSIGGHVAIYHKYQFQRWGVGEFGRLQNWIAFPQTTDIESIQHMTFGFVFTVILTILKKGFLWWPFYPVGYAVSDGWAMGWLWFSIFLGWLFKQLLFAGGGVKSYRRALPFFLGLIFGQFLAGSLWSLLAVILNKNMYTLFP